MSGLESLTLLTAWVLTQTLIPELRADLPLSRGDPLEKATRQPSPLSASAKSTKPSNSQPPPQCLNFQVGSYYGVWLIRISLRLSLYGFAVGPIGGKPLDRAVADSFIARTITGSRLNVRGTPIGPRSGPDVKKPLKRDLFQGPESKFPPQFEDFILN